MEKNTFFNHKRPVRMYFCARSISNADARVNSILRISSHFTSHGFSGVSMRFETVAGYAEAKVKREKSSIVQKKLLCSINTVVDDAKVN